MKGQHWLWLLVLLSSALMAETQLIEGFHDPDNAFVVKSDGSFVPVRELNLTPPFKITGKEGGQYLFEGSDGENYRVFIPEVVTNQSKESVILCEHSRVVFADDHRIASARGAGEGCK